MIYGITAQIAAITGSWSSGTGTGTPLATVIDEIYLVPLTVPVDLGFVTSFDVSILNPSPGDELIGVIYEKVGTEIAGRLVATSQEYMISTGDTDTVTLLFPSLVLSPGVEYFLGVHSGGTTDLEQASGTGYSVTSPYADGPPASLDNTDDWLVAGNAFAFVVNYTPATFLGVLDFTNDVYNIGGTNYALIDLIGDALGSFFYADSPFNPAQVVWGKGLYSDGVHTGRAIGAFETLLRDQDKFTLVYDIDDIFYYSPRFSGLFHTCTVDGSYQVRVRQSSFNGMLINMWSDSDGNYTDIDLTSAPENPYGLCRVAFTLGDNSAIAINGSAPATSSSDDVDVPYPSGLVAENIFPFGANTFSPGTFSGRLRRITIYAQKDDPNELTDLSSIDVVTASLGTVTTPTITSTSVEVAFTEPAGAEWYEYWIGLGEFAYPWYSDYDAWQRLPADKVITGLTPSTEYSVYIRPMSYQGKGNGNNYATFTTTA